MAELQPPESTSVQINGNGSAAAATTTVSAGAILPGAGAIAAGFLPVTSSETLGATTKRQRRPSVRLGDLGGDQSFDSHSRRAPKPWRANQSQGISVENRAGRDSTTTIGSAAKNSSKTRSMVNFSETLESEEREREGNLEAMAIGSWRHGISKESSVRKRGGGGGGGGGLAAAKRLRSNWISSSAKSGDGDEKFSGGDDNDDVDVDGGGGGENSDSPTNSMDEERENLYARRHSRISDRHNHRGDGVEVLSAPSDTEAREWNGNGHGNGGEDGVRVWLSGLGLSRYAPVFEIHEVDDEVLPMLTLEDLKDMGINAVGSRRKMFSAIQKLGKGFS